MLKTCPECRVSNSTVQVIKTPDGWECPKCGAKIKPDFEMGTAHYSVETKEKRKIGVEYYG